MPVKSERRRLSPLNSLLFVFAGELGHADKDRERTGGEVLHADRKRNGRGERLEVQKSLDVQSVRRSGCCNVHSLYNRDISATDIKQ